MPFSLLPRLMAGRVTDLSPALLSQNGVRALLLDFDNTLVPYTTDEPEPAVLDWLNRARAAGLFLCVVSNSHKPRVVRFCRAHDLPCVTHAKKPFSRGIREALSRYRLHPGETALAGDQIFTDVLGANRAGLTSILVTPLRLHNVWLRARRALEEPVIALARRKRKKSEKKAGSP